MRWLPWRVSVSSTTPSWSAARSAGFRRRCSTRSPEPCSSTMPSAPTSSTSPTPPTAPAPGCGHDAARARAGLLDGIQPPAIIRNGRMDLLATNHLGRAMHASLYDSEPGGVPNFARYTFFDDDSHRFYPNWDTAADTCVAILRTEAGRDPHDKALHDLVGELSTRSEEFRGRWSSHNVRLHGAGVKHFSHRRRAAGAGVRERRHDRRPRPVAYRLRRRTRLTYRTRTRPTGVLGGHHCGGRLPCGSLRR